MTIYRHDSALCQNENPEMDGKAFPLECALILGLIEKSDIRTSLCVYPMPIGFRCECYEVGCLAG